MKEQRDTELMLAFQRERDYAAFEELFRRHKDVLLRFVMQLTGSTSLAEDVSQQTWLKLIEAARHGGYSDRPGVAFRTWLCTLARNHFIDEYTRKFATSRTVPLPQGWDEFPPESLSPPPDPAELVDRHLRASHVQQALLGLPFEQREVIAFWAAGVELEEIVSIVRAPRDTILSRKKYAMSKLRAVLGDLSPEKRHA